MAKNVPENKHLIAELENHKKAVKERLAEKKKQKQLAKEDPERSGNLQDKNQRQFKPRPQEKVDRLIKNKKREDRQKDKLSNEQEIKSKMRLVKLNPGNDFRRMIGKRLVQEDRGSRTF